MRMLLLLVCALLGGCVPMPHRYYFAPDLQGHIVDGRSGEPLAGVRVRAISGRRNTAPQLDVRTPALDLQTLTVPAQEPTRELRQARSDADGHYHLPPATEWRFIKLLVPGCGMFWNEVLFEHPGYHTGALPVLSAFCGHNPPEIRQPRHLQVKLLPRD